MIIIKCEIDSWEKYFPLPHGRISIDCTLFVSQISFLDINSMWSIKYLKNVQKHIDNFINKINRSNDIMYLNLYLRNLAAKLHFWKTVL